jgi:bifunctional non-homologous end joining protein LigD
LTPVPTRQAVALPLVDPIVPVLRDRAFDDPAYLFEPKYDGFRGLLYLSSRGCHFRSKRGNVLKQFDQLCYWVKDELGVKEAILDGEVVSLDLEGRQDFRGLLARRGNFHYAAFDVLWLNGKDLRGLPLTRRKRALERVIPATTTVLSRIFAIEGRGRDLFAAADRLDLEGIVAKRKVDPYGPAAEWSKVKNRAYTQMAGRGELFHPKPRQATLEIARTTLKGHEIPLSG